MRISGSLAVFTIAAVSTLVACSSDSSPPAGTAGAGGSGGAGVGGGSAGGGAGTAGAGGTDNRAGFGGTMAGAAGSTAGSGGSKAGNGGSAAGSGGTAGSGGSAAGSGGSTGGSGGAAGSAGSGTGGASVTTVTPKDGTLLTCTKTQFSATPSDVTWTATSGTIDAMGLYTSPGKVGPDVTVVASSKSVAGQKATSVQKLVTAVVSAKQVAATGWTDYPDVFPHAVASSGDRVYSVGVVKDAMGGYAIRVARSDDAGKSWAAPVTASPAVAVGAALSCAAIAVDAGNPDIVHVVFNASPKSGLAPTYVDPGIDDESALVLVTSIDGGKTFAQVRVLQSGNAADPLPVAQGICPDVTSPKADAVVVETPGGSNDTSLFVWSDQKHGQGLVVGQQDAWNSIAAEETGALATIGADIGQNGGSNSATESPRLFTDGKGKLCITYVAFTPKGSGSPSSTAWVQCSPDLGASFGSPVAASPTYPYGGPGISHPTGTFGPNGEIAIAWHGFPAEPINGVNVVGVAVSTDGGKMFTNVSAPVYQEMATSFSSSVVDLRFDDAGVLWLAYGVYDGGFNDRIVIDKTCDLGKTWSGAIVVNALADGSIENATRPSLVPTKGRVAVFVGANLGDALDDTELRRYTLQP